jgi:hypothetical protein
MAAFRVIIKESVFRETSLDKEKYGEEAELAFDRSDGDGNRSTDGT